MEDYHRHHQTSHASLCRIYKYHLWIEHIFLLNASIDGGQHLKFWEGYYFTQKSTQVKLFRDMKQTKMLTQTCEFDLGGNIYSNNNYIRTRSKHNICCFWVPIDLQVKRKCWVSISYPRGDRNLSVWVEPSS